MWLTGNINPVSFVFRHPKYYEELRKIRKQEGTRPAPDPVVVTEEDLKALEEIDKQQAASAKQQATSSKQQAASRKLQASKDSSSKPQASSPEQQAASDKPQAASSKISEPL